MSDSLSNAGWTDSPSVAMLDSLAALERNLSQLVAYRRALESQSDDQSQMDSLRTTLEAARLRSLANQEFLRRRDLRATLAPTGVRPEFQLGRLEAQIDRHRRIAQLTTTEFHSTEPTAVDCGICLDAMNEGDKIPQLPCRHQFHQDCLNNWLLLQYDTCPFCRRNLLGDN